MSDGLRDLFLTLSPKARARLRDVLILDQPERDAIAQELLRFDDANGDAWADLLDTLSMNADARRVVVRKLAEMDAARLTQGEP